MKKFTKSDIKTGMFGVMSGDRGQFVIVGDLIVYRDGEFDRLCELNQRLNFLFYGIEKLYTGVNSFAQLDKAVESEKYGTCVYDSECTMMTLSEIEEALGIENLKIVKEDK